MRTDELVEIIVKKIGCKIPYYDYKYKKFISEVPLNMRLGDSVRGIEKPSTFDNFHEACLYVYNWAVKNNVLNNEK